MVVSILVWVLWVIPVNRSVAAAAPTEVGEPIVAEFDRGAHVGIWAKGLSPQLESMECSVRGPGGRAVSVLLDRELAWDDTLFWLTARAGFFSDRGFTAAAQGAHVVKCVDSLGIYDGEYLVADMVTGTGSMRVRGVPVSIHSALSVAAVGAPLMAILLLPLMGIQSIRFTRSWASRGVEPSSTPEDMAK